MKVGVLSSSLWATPQIFSIIQKIGKHNPTKFYLSAGNL